MYLNKIKITLMSIAASIIMIIGISFVIFAILGILIGLDEPENLREDLSIGGGILIAFLIVFLIGWALKKPLRYARKFNSIFESSTDGKLSVTAAASFLGISEEKVIRQFNAAQNKGYLINCHLQASPTAQFILSADTNKSADKRFRTVNCPHCGAPATVQEGFLAACEYCGSKINR